jgi:hypothetical protein
MLYTAILIACLISAPGDCREVELYLVARMPTAAAIEAQTRAATWLEQHPGMVKKSLRVVQGRAA